jgi:chemotaxis protein MotB
MKLFKVAVIATGLLGSASYASAVDLSAVDLQGICCDGGYEYRHPSAWEKEQQRLRDELAAARKQLEDRDREIASLRSGSSDSLRSAQAELDRSKSQLADRDREIASLRSSAGDSSALASQLSTAQGEKGLLAAELAASTASLAALKAGGGDKDKLAAELAAANQRNAALESQLAALQSTSGDNAKLAAECAAARQRIAELEGQLADRDKELASLRGDLSTEMAKLKEAQRGLIRALRPQIEKGTITVDLNNDRLLINLASGYLFGSGEDQLKPAGADALKQVGAILKDFPEYKVAVEGHTDNRPIRSSLKKKFPTNKELSEARAAHAAKALTEGGLGAATTTGYSDTKPVAPNTTDAGRAKNRRVEVRVTK